MLPRVLKGSNPVMPGDVFPTAPSLAEAPETSRMSGDPAIAVFATGDVDPPVFQMDDTGFQALLVFVLIGVASQSPGDGAEPTACHGSGAGSGLTLFGLLVSHRLSWAGTTGISNPGHCSPENKRTSQILSVLIIFFFLFVFSELSVPLYSCFLSRYVVSFSLPLTTFCWYSTKRLRRSA